MLLLLKGTVTNKEFVLNDTSEHADSADTICKNPEALTAIPNIPNPVILVRDPRAVLTSKLNGKYFVKPKELIDCYHAMKKYTPHSIFRYEHLVARPDQTQAQLGDYWKLTYRNDFSDWPNLPMEVNKRLRDKMNGLRAIDIGHHYGIHSVVLRKYFDKYPELHDILIDLQYVKNKKWYDEVIRRSDNPVPIKEEFVRGKYNVKPNTLRRGARD